MPSRPIQPTSNRTESTNTGSTNTGSTNTGSTTSPSFTGASIDTTAQTVAELVAAARMRDKTAWEELTRRYGTLVRGVVARYRLQEADAADAAQYTWLRAIERLETLRDSERFGAWLASIAGRECLALLRRSRRERPDEAMLEAQVSPASGPESLVVAAEINRAVVAAVADLAPQRRQLVNELFYRPDQDYGQVSRSMNMPVGSIGPTRGRVLAGLRTSLDRAGFGPGPGPCHLPGRLTA
jgi:RNA polymerase sigma factor (sigma-70 family)